jgi:hypothetical protein
MNDDAIALPIAMMTIGVLLASGRMWMCVRFVDWVTRLAESIVDRTVWLVCRAQWWRNV